MGRGKKITEVEVKLIHNLHNDGFTNRKIAQNVNRSVDLVNKVLKTVDYHIKYKYKGKKPALTPREKRLLAKKASNSFKTCRSIAAEIGVKCSLRTVQRFIKSNPNLERKKIKRRPVLNKTHITNRLNFAKSHMHWTKEWRTVLFSDEKRFCLDGPDAYSYYFHNLKMPELNQMRRQQGGGGVMLWGVITSYGKSKFTIVEGTLNSASYLKLLNDEFLPFYKQLRRRNLTFQQDNARPHTAKDTIAWFESKKIKVMQWPARSPDLNIIENLWSTLSRIVYANGKQFNNISELKSAVLDACDQLRPNDITTLYDSLSNRMYETILKSGKYTHY